MLAQSPEVQLVELAYTPESGTTEWMRSVGRLVREIVPGVASQVQVFEVVDDAFTLSRLWADTPELEQGLRALIHAIPSEQLAMFLPAPLSAGTIREIFADHGVDFESTGLPAALEDMGVFDIFSVAAVGASGRGVSFGVGLTQSTSPAAPIRARLSQVGAHVAAGMRLRQRIGAAAPAQVADAIMTPEGKVEHLADASVDRQALSEAVRRVELARAGGCDASEALSLWQALVAGQWSLVDHFEGGGRRYYVAVENAPEAVRSRRLTRREAEVVAYIAAGTDIKSVAYALGLDAVTVRGHLRVALAKLGLSTRTELIRLHSMLGSKRDEVRGPA